MRYLSRPTGFGLILLVPLTLPSLAGAQAPTGSPGEDAFAPAGLASGPYGEMSALLEVTILKIDVLTLTVRVPDEAATRLRSLVASGDRGDELADSVASAILETEHLWARQVFHRDVGYGRLLGGMRESSERAVEAGFITPQYHDLFSAELSSWFAFLENVGARKGDEIVFWVRGDSVRTIYRTVDGEVPLDVTASDGQARRGSVPSFFAPGSRFRKSLVESLVEGAQRAP